jgi:hypothetical protein
MSKALAIAAMPFGASLYWSMRALRRVSPRVAEKITMTLFERELWTIYDLVGTTGDKVFALMTDDQIDEKWRAEVVRSLESHGQTADDIAEIRRSFPAGTAVGQIFAAIEGAKRASER